MTSTLRPLGTRLGKSLRILFAITGAIILITGIAVLMGWLDSPLSAAIATAARRSASSSWPGYFRGAGAALVGLGILLVLAEQVLSGMNRLGQWGKAQIEAVDRWLETRSKRLLHPPAEGIPDWPIRFERWDALIVLLFLFIALVYQLATMSRGFPTVILSGDGGAYASYAAGQAFPELFKSDAILGNQSNYALHVTVQLWLTIWLEKLLGNFGLAYSLMLFPVVFLQYFSFYLLGRVLYHSRYWAFLFSLAVSVSLVLDNGEFWGIGNDAIPRFTFQVLIPLVLILPLAAWRERPTRWPWLMIILGLMAFVHPLSAPVWAFALWFGFLPILPADWNARRRLFEMLKLGAILVLALLPYLSVYLTHYHRGDIGSRNYDLVYLLLTEYGSYNRFNVPGAVGDMLRSTAHLGLLWYGLAGLTLTVLLFRDQLPRLKQILVWASCIAFIGIVVPWAEFTIERALRIIPLETELVRAIRYLVMFLFIFWFYPFAELSRRAVQVWLNRAVLAAGTLLTLSYLAVNPPQPFRLAPYVFDCWGRGQWICPRDTDYADVLRHVREDTPEGSKFVVFLTGRWSGIEVRYLGLRPMVYAFKDVGLLVFTNLDALEEWYYFEQRENAIFSRNSNPLLANKRTRIVDFARDIGADYILTDFPFPAEIRQRLNVTAVYQNSKYYILKLNANAP